MAACALGADKDLLGRRFARARATYEQEARVQTLVADTLLEHLLATLPGTAPESALEIGCCTGMLTQRLVERLPMLQDLSVCDLVAAFRHCIEEKSRAWRQRVTFLAGDIETLALPDCYDLILSSSTLHWVHDFPALSARLARHLRAKGALAIALYGPDNFREIREITGFGLGYYDLEAVGRILSRHFRLQLARESREKLWFPDPLAVLRHLRATGVNALHSGGWTRGRLTAFAAAYRQRFGTARGVPLTYHPLYLVATGRQD